MKVLVAVDSFKGSLGSREAGEIIKEGILDTIKDAEVTVSPIADGGEGTVEALVDGLNGEYIDVEVKGPLNDKVIARYGVIKDVVVMEMASSSGLTLVPEEKRNPLNTTTYGLGDMIKDALDRGYNNFIIGLGGSSTSDIGLGMLSSLGFKFLDENKKEVGIFGRDLKNIKYIDDTSVDKRLFDSKFKIACDVDNPLYGENGAAAIYGPQKGADKETIKTLDEYAINFSKVVSKKYKIDYDNISGVGAAGGLGYAFMSFLNGELSPGIDIIIDFLKLDEKMKKVDLAITGEGEINYQTMMGKAPSGVAEVAKKYDIPVIGIAGALGKDVELINDKGIDAFFSITPKPISLEKAMDREFAKENLKRTISQIMRVYRLNNKN